MALSERLHRALLENAVDLANDDLAPLREVAREHQVTVVCGINERDGAFSRGTLYNTVVTIGAEGSLLNRHRKLMPTNPERMVWGQGDATGLRPVDRACGRFGALICWESYMPLARYALYAQGLDVCIAPIYDSGDRWIATLQHIAREAGCWVVGSGVAFRASDIRVAAPGMADLYTTPIGSALHAGSRRWRIGIPTWHSAARRLRSVRCNALLGGVRANMRVLVLDRFQEAP